MTDCNPLKARLAELQRRGEAAFMPFLVIGDPDLETSMAAAEALCDGGADIIEFGFPFSDPPADGPVIQAADHRALRAGTTPTDCLKFIAEFRRRRDVPVALLLYFNLVLQRGVRRFYEEAASAGVHAVLVADVPLEACSELVEAARRVGVAPVFIASELSTPARLQQLAGFADGYVYALARVGITGEQSQLDGRLTETVAKVRNVTSLPILAGFGISTPAHVRAVRAAGADGAICGSALVRKIEAYVAGTCSRDQLLDDLRNTAAQMKAACLAD